MRVLVSAASAALLLVAAEARPGGEFDVRAFHTELLKDGAMRLSVLESRLERWVTAEL